MALVRHEPGKPGPPNHSVDGQLNAICGGDDAFSRELAESFLESAPRCLSGISTALSVAIRGPWPLTRMLERDQPHDRGRRPGTLCGGLEDMGNWGDPKAAATMAARLGNAWERVRTALEQLLSQEPGNENPHCRGPAAHGPVPAPNAGENGP